jgi:hypothetical protein
MIKTIHTAKTQITSSFSEASVSVARAHFVLRYDEYRTLDDVLMSKAVDDGEEIELPSVWLRVTEDFGNGMQMCEVMLMPIEGPTTGVHEDWSKTTIEGEPPSSVRHRQPYQDVTTEVEAPVPDSPSPRVRTLPIRALAHMTNEEIIAYLNQ